MSAVRRLLVTQDGYGNYLAGGRYLPRILGASAVAVSGPADTSENILATITIPAGAMGLNGLVRVTTLWSYTNSANNKILSVRYSGAAGTQISTATATTTAGARIGSQFQNRGAANSQVYGMQGATGGWGTAGTAPGAMSVDTSVATTIVIAGQKASAGETLTLESYLVELILP